MNVTLILRNGKFDEWVYDHEFMTVFVTAISLANKWNKVIIHKTNRTQTKMWNAVKLSDQTYTRLGPKWGDSWLELWNAVILSDQTYTRLGPKWGDSWLEFCKGKSLSSLGDISISASNLVSAAISLRCSWRT